MAPVKWFSRVLRRWWMLAVLGVDGNGPATQEHVGATEDWSIKADLPPAGPLPEEIEAREALEAEQARISAEPIPMFDNTWDSLMAAGVLTGQGADVDAEFAAWGTDDETLSRIHEALQEDDEPTTGSIRVSV